MPCQVIETEEEIRQRVRRRALSEVAEGRALLAKEEELENQIKKYAELLANNKKQIEFINAQERVICKMYNQLFDWGILEKMLLTDKEVRDKFYEHQELDRVQGRPFIAVVNGVLSRIQVPPTQSVEIKE